MKNKIYIILIFLLANLGCKENNELISQLNSEENYLQLIPINYNHEKLSLKLNSTIKYERVNSFWRWDYMTSNNGGPDLKGEDFFMNYSQPIFSYNQEETLPALWIKTNNSKITEFTAVTIFHIMEENPEPIKEILECLTTYDLLNDEEIREEVINNGFYKHSNEYFEESITLNIAEEKYRYDKIEYKIKNIE